jgi:hypothetical protein
MLSRMDFDDTYDIKQEPLDEVFTISLEKDEFPVTWELISQAQEEDQELTTKIRNNPDHYSIKKRDDKDIVYFKGKIYIPTSLRAHILTWYHEMLCHPGQTRMEGTLRAHFTWKGLKNDVKRQVQDCRICQKYKKQQKKYGKLPPKKAEAKPWKYVCVNLVGPYKATTPSGEKTLHAITMIDPATSWFEIAEIPDKTSETVSLTFDREWLCRYPCPRRCIYDKGAEFIAKDFKKLLKSYGIKKRPITTKNPQANAIIERVHQVLGNMLRTFELEHKEFDEIDPWKGFLSAVAFAIRSTYHTTLQASPGQLVFGRDMIMNTEYIANWHRIRSRKQRIINKSNRRENASRIRHEYNVGDMVLITNVGKRKLDMPHQGPYPVTQVYTNGTLEVRRGAVYERLNIRRVTPFRQR